MKSDSDSNAVTTTYKTPPGSELDKLDLPRMRVGGLCVGIYDADTFGTRTILLCLAPQQ